MLLWSKDQLSLTNPRDALHHHGKVQNLKTVKDHNYSHLGGYVILLVKLDIVYLCKKFEILASVRLFVRYDWGLKI